MLSKNGIGLAIIIIEGVLKSMGVDYDSTALTRSIEGILYLIGLLLMLSHQFQREDIKGFLFKA